MVFGAIGFTTGPWEWGSRNGGGIMANETAAILEIMQAVGIYDFVMGKVKNQAEAVALFKEGFQLSIQICVK
jgi:hypothetical protein